MDETFTQIASIPKTPEIIILKLTLFGDKNDGDRLRPHVAISFWRPHTHWQEFETFALFMFLMDPINSAANGLFRQPFLRRRVGGRCPAAATATTTATATSGMDVDIRRYAAGRQDDKKGCHYYGSDGYYCLSLIHRSSS